MLARLNFPTPAQTLSRRLPHYPRECNPHPNPVASQPGVRKTSLANHSVLRPCSLSHSPRGPCAWGTHQLSGASVPWGTFNDYSGSFHSPGKRGSEKVGGDSPPRGKALLAPCSGRLVQGLDERSLSVRVFTCTERHEKGGGVSAERFVNSETASARRPGRSAFQDLATTPTERRARLQRSEARRTRK
jgi:hypothetical protein